MPHSSHQKGRLLFFAFIIALPIYFWFHTHPDPIKRVDVTAKKMESDIISFLKTAKDIHPKLNLYKSNNELIKLSKNDIKLLCSDVCSINQQNILISKLISRIGTDHVFLPRTKELPITIYKEGINYYFFDKEKSVSNKIDTINKKAPGEIWQDLQDVSRRLNTNIDNSYISRVSAVALPWVLDSKVIHIKSGNSTHVFTPLDIKTENYIALNKEKYTYLKIPNMSKISLARIRKDIESHKKSVLVIDLRGNPGGSAPRTAKLYEMITGKNGFEEISPYKNRLIMLSKSHTKIKRENIIWPLTSLFLECGIKDSFYYNNDDAAHYSMCKNVEADTRVKKVRYVNTVYVIIDGGTGSAAAILAHALRSNGAKIFGLTAYGNGLRNFGGPIGVQLNNTKLSIGVPTTYTDRDSPSGEINWPTSEFKGVSPDTECMFDKCIALIDELSNMCDS